MNHHYEPEFKEKLVRLHLEDGRSLKNLQMSAWLNMKRKTDSSCSCSAKKGLAKLIFISSTRPFFSLTRNKPDNRLDYL